MRFVKEEDVKVLKLILPLTCLIGILTAFYPIYLGISSLALILLIVVVFFLKVTDVFSPVVGFLSVYFLYYIIGSIKVFSIYGQEVPLDIWKYILLGAVCFLFGVLASYLIPMQPIPAKDFSENVNVRRAKRVVYFMTVWGFVFLGLNFLKFGVPLLAADRYHTFSNFWHHGVPYLTYQWYFLFVTCTFSFLMFLKSGKKFFLLISVLIFCSYLLTLKRGTPIRLMMIWIVLYHFFKRKIGLRYLLAGIVGIIIFSGFILTLRSGGYGGILKNSYSLVRCTLETFWKIIYLVPDKVEYFKGYFTFGQWITLLPGHQESPGFLITKKILSYSSAYYGTTPSFIGGLYLDYGVLAIIAGCFILGFVLNLLYRKGKRDRNFFFFYSYIFVMSLTLLYSGGIIFFSTVGIWTLTLMKLAYSYTFKGRFTQIDYLLLIPVSLGMLLALIKLPGFLG